MKKTKNYAMPYPEQDDYFNVEDFQDMMVSVDDLMKKLSDSGAQISSDAEHLYNQTKAQMDNIQKRMNAFTALKEGSTTGDAELTDIRVAYDGKEYGNAGEAVREQASDIHKALFGAGASIWSKAKSESTKYVAETKGICILNERFTAAGVVAKISRGTFAQNESTLNLDRECSAYIVEFEKNPGTVYMPSAETIKIVSTTKIIFEANGNARCWIPVEKGQYLAVDSTATAYTCESNHVPYMLYNQANKTLECRGFGSTGSIEPVDPYSLALEYKLEYDMDDTGLVKQIDANREVVDSLKEDIVDLRSYEETEYPIIVTPRNGVYNGENWFDGQNTELRSYVFDVSSGDKLKIDFSSTGWTPNIVYFKNDVFIGSDTSDSTATRYTNRIITVPLGVDKIAINTVGGAYLRKLGLYKNNDAETILKEYEPYVADETIVEGKAYKNNTGSISLQDGKPNNKAISIPLVEGEYRLTVWQTEKNFHTYIDNNKVCDSVGKNDEKSYENIFCFSVPSSCTLYTNGNNNLSYGSTDCKIEKIANIKISDYKPSVPSETSGKSNSIVIASSNASDVAKTAANYVCDGSNDALVINTAIQSLPTDGGEIKLTNGLFNIGRTILIDRPVKLSGEGHGIAGIPPYAPTDGQPYQNLYERTLGTTTLRASADIDIVKVNASEKISGIVLRDFLLQGYGKNRHTKAGIRMSSETDLTFMQNLSVTDCKIGLCCDEKMDACNINNCSFQWCGCGAIVKGMFGRFDGNCIADNDGVEVFESKNINCGGIYAEDITSINFIDNQIIRPTKYATSASAIRFKNCNKCCISNNVISVVHGNGMSFEECNFEIISNNTVEQCGIGAVDGNKIGIYLGAICAKFIVSNNRIGASGGTQNPTVEYPVKADTTWGHHMCWNNFFYCCVNDALFAGTNAIVKDNVSYSES